MLDVESYVKCKSFAVRPIELGAFENRGIIVAIVVYQLHQCLVPLARAERHYWLTRASYESDFQERSSDA